MKNNLTKLVAPLPLFDTMAFIKDQTAEDLELPNSWVDDFNQALSFLKCYVGSVGTFNSYRRDVERLLHWTWTVSGKSVKDLKRDDIEAFIQFCIQPPKSWIGFVKNPRFIKKEGIRTPNPLWRPFVVTLSKKEIRDGKKPTIKDYEFTQGSIKELFAIISSFYNYMLQEEYVFMNPVAMLRQKSKFIRKDQGFNKIRRLSPLQWNTVIKTTQDMAATDSEKYERTLFILSLLYGMYLRISEVVASDRWTPQMKHFYKDQDENWWFVTVGKGNKQRQIAVSDSMLDSLKRWRRYLGLSPLPTPADNSPLIPKIKGKGPITHTTYVRNLVQKAFDNAAYALIQKGNKQEAEVLMEATVHWLRHTGISDDVKIRPREHVRDDAGHSSSAITDKYIDIELKERHATAKNKRIS